jgi:hypothetical protein
MAYFPDFRPMRSFILQNFRSDNDRPKIWFDDSEGWRKAFVERAGDYTKPPWAAWGKLPFFEPFKDFVGVLILDRPDSDHLQQWRGYITTR